MSEIIFKPWVGADYESGIFGRKILIMAENHFFGAENAPLELSDEAACTSNAIAAVLADTSDFSDAGKGGWTDTFKKFERALFGKEPTQSDRQKIWNSLAFYNYIQGVVNSPHPTMPPSLLEKSAAAFFEVLETLAPDLIVCWGVARFYSIMSGKNWKQFPSKYFGDYGVKNGKYILRGGEVTTIWTHHPAGNFDCAYWHKVLQAF